MSKDSKLDPCHPLVLKPKAHKPSDQYHSEDIICNRCLTPLTGPFYCCERGDNYYLHKVCAELPNEMKHPLHPQHTLHLSSHPSSSSNSICDICSEKCVGFIYQCDSTSTCKFVVDLICASASHTIEDKCHMHPLTPLLLSSPFTCHICRTKEKGVSYKCGMCSFWVHQNCTLLPTTVVHSDHEHLLTLLHSIPIEYQNIFNSVCDICHGKMRKFETVYSCVGCLFFAHASCATSSENKPSSDYHDHSRVEDDTVLDLTLLPVRNDWTSIISSIVEKSKRAEDITPSEIYHFSHNHLLHLHNEGEGNRCEACANPILGLSYHCAPCHFYLHMFCTELPDHNDIYNRIRHFSHDHPLYLLVEESNKNFITKVCDACSEPVSHLSYGCTQCDYFLHKCCIELPKVFQEPFQAEHKMELFVQFPNKLGMFACSYCAHYCNGFGYYSTESVLDLKCASLAGSIKHEAHKHALTKRIHLMASCSVCPGGKTSYVLQCESCSFSICQYCAMLPPIINHRYCNHGLRLHYSPIKNYDIDYICDLCEETLQPKFWFYYCSDCEQFAHPTCLINNACHSNIKFGKYFNLPDHGHMLTLTSFTHVKTLCKVCHNSLNYGYAVGFKCATCDFKIHVNCVVDNRLPQKMLRL